MFSCPCGTCVPILPEWRASFLAKDVRRPFAPACEGTDMPFLESTSCSEDEGVGETKYSDAITSSGTCKECDVFGLVSCGVSKGPKRQHDNFTDRSIVSAWLEAYEPRPFARNNPRARLTSILSPTIKSRRDP